MKADPLLSPKLKIERANRHIVDVTAQIITFLRTNGDLVQPLLEPDPDGVRQIVKAKLLKLPPPDIALAVGDAISNLRSSLDHLVRCLAIKNSGNPDDVSFPFAGSWERFMEPGTQRKILPLSSDARQMICDLQPYLISETEPGKGGNNMLWGLNRLRNGDIHKMIAPLGMAIFGGASVTTSWLGYGEIESPRRMRFDENMTAEIMRVPGKPEDIKAELKLGLDIGFGDIEPVTDMPVTHVLHDFSNLASRILSTFEVRFF